MRVVKNSRCPQAPSTLSEWTARRQSMSIVFSIAIGSLTLSSATINDSQVVSSRRELGRWATPGCDAWCSEYTCYDAADPNRNRECLLCPWCQGPPSPPAPPVNPGHCAYTYQPCFQQWPIIAPLCCVRETDGCYRRKGRLYAMCKPLPPYGTPCVDDDTWLCPGTWGASPPTPPTPPAAPSPPPPPPCAGHYKECTHSMCCLNGWPCLKKRGRWFAQCRNPRRCRRSINMASAGRQTNGTVQDGNIRHHRHHYHRHHPRPLHQVYRYGTVRSRTKHAGVLGRRHHSRRRAPCHQ